MNPQTLQGTNDCGRVALHPHREVGLGIFGVGNTQAAACIYVTDVVPGVSKTAYESGNALHRFAEGVDVEDLRANVNADACRLEVRGRDTLVVEFRRIAHRHSELVFVQAGRNIRVSASVHVGIHAHGEEGGLAQVRGASGKKLQLAGALDVKEQNAGA